DTPLKAPPELDALGPVVERAGRPDPDDRPDAAGFARDLDAAARHLPTPDALPLVGPPDDVTRVADDETELGVSSAAATPVVAAAGRRRRRWPWAVLLAVLVLAGGATAFALTRPAAAPTHRLPALQTKTETDAIAALQPLKVKVHVNRPFVDGVSAGLVIDTKPSAGT